MILLRRISLVAFAILLLYVAISSNHSYSVPTDAQPLNNNSIKLIIDAGHGGFDGGASASDGTLEKDINLQIALELYDFCKLGGHQVILTRNSDAGTEKDENDSIANRKKSDMQRRLSIIEENPDAIFVSIHLNKFTTSTAQGAQVFYSKNNINSQNLAKSVQSSIILLTQPNNTRTIKKGDNSIFLLKKATIPAIIVECGFLSNPEELALLKNSEYQSKIAFSIYCGILKYYN